MPETRELINSVDQLHTSVQALTSEMHTLVERVEVDRQFRRRVTTALIVAVIWSVVLSGWAGYEVATERREACQTANQFRRDLYSGVDAVLDSITVDATPEVRESVDEAKAAIREQVPVRGDC